MRILILVAVIGLLFATPVYAQTGAPSSGQGAQIIIQSLNEALGEGLGWLSRMSVFLVVIFWVYLSIGIAFNYANEVDITAAFMGSCWIIGVQSIGAIFYTVFT
jgi:hypothetical protein